MYSLLPDETGCKSVLGTLLYCERKNFGFAAKVVDVELPSSRLFGHVEYKLEISVRIFLSKILFCRMNRTKLLNLLDLITFFSRFLKIFQKC